MDTLYIGKCRFGRSVVDQRNGRVAECSCDGKHDQHGGCSNSTLVTF